MIELAGGPYNGRIIDDPGFTTLKMCVYDPREEVGAKVGEAVYEIGEDRKTAFWLGNNWLGTLEEVLPAE